MPRTPLYEQVILYLKHLISENKDNPSYKLPSEHNLMQMFNVSRITVIKALDSLEKDGIIRRIHGKGSFINEGIENEIFIDDTKSGKQLFSSKKVISVIIPDITSMYYIDILNAILNKASSENVLLQIQNVNAQIQNEPETIKNMIYSSDGLILFPLDNMNYTKELLRFSLNNFPICCIDNYLKKTNIPCVVSDNQNAIYKATSFLIESGRSNVAYISLNRKNEYALEERYNGYVRAVLDNKLIPNKAIIKDDLTHIDIFVNNILDEFLLNSNIDAIITANYGLGIKVAEILLENGKEELIDNLIIFDDEFGKLKNILKFKPKCIKQNAYKIGETAFDIVLNQMKNKNRNIHANIIRIETEAKY